MTKQKEKAPEIKIEVPTLAKINGKYHKVIIGEEVEALPMVSNLLGKNGLFTMRSNPLYSNVAKADGKVPSDLDEVKEEALHFYPKISYNIYTTTLEFLREVHKEYKGEGSVLLYLNRNSETPYNEQEYRMYIPKQEVTGGHVDYEIGDDRPPTDEGWFLAGSIHSHPSFSAFQSGTDHKDEWNSDGVHYTLGHIDRVTPEIHGRLCVGGVVYTLKPVDKLMDVTPPHTAEFPQEWMSKVSKPTSKGNINTAYQQHHVNQIGFDTEKKSDFSLSVTGKNIIKDIFRLIKPKPQIMKNTKTLNTKGLEKCKILS